MKIAPEGWPFVVFFAAIAAGTYFLFGRNILVASAPFVIVLFMFYFFRDPDRAPASAEGFVAPADGRVIVVKETDEYPDVGKGALKISIFMSPMNVHVNRASCAGSVESVKHFPGSYKAAYKDEASSLNERTELLIKTPGGSRVMQRQVAGFIARRTVCRVGAGDSLERGARYGLIKFSSRVDAYFPPGAKPSVKIGDRVKSGETIVAMPPSKGVK